MRNDLLQSWRLRRFWLSLALFDIQRTYRRSLLGPIWPALSFAIIVASIGWLYSTVLDLDIHFYAPYLALGYVTWIFIATSLAEGTRAFVSAAGLITDHPMPLAMFAFRVVAKATYQFLIHLPIVLLVLIAVGPGLNQWTLLSVFGLLLLVINSIWVTLLFGVLGARFPDIFELVQSALRIFFLLTPIIWVKDVVPRAENVALWNPFYHAIEIVRAPALGAPAASESYLVIGVITILGFVIAIPAFAYFGRRIPYWI